MTTTAAPSGLPADYIVLSVSRPVDAAPTLVPRNLAGRQDNATFHPQPGSSLSPVDDDLGYISATGTTDSCADANYYMTSGGQLTDESNGVMVAAKPDLFAITMNHPIPGTISTDIEVVNNILVWHNPAFYQDTAVFCEQNEIVYATFNASGPPAGCTVIDLVVIAGMSIRGPSESRSILTHRFSQFLSRHRCQQLVIGFCSERDSVPGERQPSAPTRWKPNILSTWKAERYQLRAPANRI